jgi:hypothetical protein
MNDLRNSLIEEYRILLNKNYKYQMGDDDYSLTTQELTICRAVQAILNDLDIKYGK